MALPYALLEQSVISEQYKELVILVPEWLQQHSEELIDNQKDAIDFGAVSTESVTQLEHHLYWGCAFGSSLACYYFNIPPIGREWLHIMYPSLVPFSWIETRSPGPRVVAGIFGVLKKAWFEKWFKQSRASELEMKVVMERHLKHSKSLNSSPLMYLPLRSDLSDHTKISYLREERLEELIQASTPYLSDTKKPAIYHSIRTFKLSDTEEPGWVYGKRTFNLSDTKELESFYRNRLEYISKEVVDKITFCWFQRLASRLSTQHMEAVLNLDLSKQEKRDVITTATRLLLRHGVDKAKVQAPWIEDLKEATTRIVNEIPANQFSASLEEDYRVVEDVLPSLFYVAQCHEHRQNQPTSNPEMIIEWQYIARRHDGQREGHHTTPILCC